MTPGDHLFRTILDSTVRMLAKEIKAKDAQLLEQDKLIANLTEENERLKPMRRKVKFVEKVRTGKASSWRRSAWLGLRDGILMAPDRLFQSLKLPILGTVFGALTILGNVSAWLVARPLILIAGLCGYLVEKKELETR
jgi:hypothetical protein